MGSDAMDLIISGVTTSLTLTPQKTFNLLCFANKLRWYSTRMQAATKKNLASAHAWVDAVTLELETNTYDALEMAFHYAGRGAADRHYELLADTVFFLSDGRPSTGDASVLAAAQAARAAGMSIASVCVGLDCDAALMRQLASQPDLFFAG